MKFNDSVEIGLPREEVLRLLLDPAHLSMWFRGLVMHEPLNGGHGEVGTAARVVFRRGTEEVDVTETIMRREPTNPSGISGETDVIVEREFVADGMRGVIRDKISVMNPRRTRWERENEYRFDNLKMRLLAHVKRTEYQTQARQHMRDFKAFAEQGVDVRSTQGGTSEASGYGG